MPSALCTRPKITRSDLMQTICFKWKECWNYASHAMCPSPKYAYFVWIINNDLNDIILFGNCHLLQANKPDI